MAAPSAMPVLLTPKQVAARLALSLTAVYALCDSGELPCHKVGVSRSRRRIAEADLAEYLERTRATPVTVQLPTGTRRRAAAGADGGFILLRAAGWRG